MIDDAEVSALIKAERARLAVMFILFAISRDIEAKATGDQRFGAAANSVKQIEATMVQVSDDVLINLMSVNESSNGMLTTLITARLRAVVRLVRVRIGSLADRRLSPGDWRPLTQREVRDLERAVATTRPGGARR